VKVAVSREEHDELMRRVTAGEAVHVTMQADIVRIDKEVILVTHSIQGDGIPGLAEDVRDLKIWKAALPDQGRASRTRTIVIIATLLAMAVSLFIILDRVKAWK
jgi:hypothetical protein